jgi:hypothetical protein
MALLASTPSILIRAPVLVASSVFLVRRTSTNALPILARTVLLALMVLPVTAVPAQAVTAGLRVRPKSMNVLRILVNTAAHVSTASIRMLAFVPTVFLVSDVKSTSMSAARVLV